MLSFSFYCLPNVSAQIDQATANLQAANYAVEKAFNSVLDAEGVGANITSLLNQINRANELLAQAENAYRAGNNTEALNSADSALLIAQQVTSTALSLKVSASSSLQTAFLYSVLSTVIAAQIFVLALSFVWVRFKRRYIKKLTNSKPKVVIAQ